MEVLVGVERLVRVCLEHAASIAVVVAGTGDQVRPQSHARQSADMVRICTFQVQWRGRDNNRLILLEPGRATFLLADVVVCEFHGAISQV